MPGSPAHSNPSSRNNSIHNRNYFSTIPEVTSNQDQRKLGPKFAREMHQYGENCFTGAVAKKYLIEAGVPTDKIDFVFEDSAVLLQVCLCDRTIMSLTSSMYANSCVRSRSISLIGAVQGSGCSSSTCMGKGTRGDDVHARLPATRLGGSRRFDWPSPQCHVPPR